MSLDNISGLKRENFQAEIQGKKTDLFILKNVHGNEVAITNYGGALVAIMVPDKEGAAGPRSRDRRRDRGGRRRGRAIQGG